MNKSIFYRFAVTLAFGLLAAMPVYAGGGGWLIKPLGLMLGGAMVITIILTGLSKPTSCHSSSWVLWWDWLWGPNFGVGRPWVTLSWNGLNPLWIPGNWNHPGDVHGRVNFNIKDITKRPGFIISNGVGFIGLGLCSFTGLQRVLPEPKVSVKHFLCPGLVVPSSFLVSASLQYREDEDSRMDRLPPVPQWSGLYWRWYPGKTASHRRPWFRASSAVSNLWLTEQILLLVVIVMLISKFILSQLSVICFAPQNCFSSALLVTAWGSLRYVGALEFLRKPSFFTGISLGSLPYNDVEDKVGPLKSLERFCFSWPLVWICRPGRLALQ